MAAIVYQVPPIIFPTLLCFETIDKSVMSDGGWEFGD